MVETSEGRISGKARSDSSGDREDNENEEELRRLRYLLKKDFNMFLLDNTLMAVQFFRNYDRDIATLRENCLNESQLGSDQLKTFEADTLYELIPVTFKKGSIRAEEEPIHPRRTYVTYENVKLAYNITSVNKKSCVGSPCYKLIVRSCEDDHKEASGFVNLIENGTTEFPVADYQTSIPHPEGELESKDDNNGFRRKNTVMSEVIVPRSENFYYLHPEGRWRPYEMEVYRTMERVTENGVIPRGCFKEKQQEVIMNRRTGYFRKTKKEVQSTLLLSSAFKRHFTEVFVQSLKDKLKFNKCTVQKMMFHYDHVVAREHGTVRFVVPALELGEWPSCAVNFGKWEMKKRKNWIEWPTERMQEEIVRAGCSVIPIGYHESSNEPNDYTLEWKFEFPKAEKYLLLHMMHSHVRCYLFALILYKTYVEIDAHIMHFGPSHIANLLFLMVRRDFLSWPEYNQGETLLQFLQVLVKTLQNQELKDFFIHQRNVYGNSPLKIIHRCLTLFSRMVQNPIPHVLKAFSKLKYTTNDFYPEFDFLHLYNVLTVENLDKYFKYLRPPVPEENPVKRRRNRRKPVEEEQPPGVTEIDENLQFKPNATPTIRKTVLEMFIHHFIKIADCSHKNGAENQAMLYLTHSQRLTVLLEEESVHQSEVQSILNSIDKVKSKINKNRRAEVKPRSIFDELKVKSEIINALNRKIRFGDGKLTGNRSGEVGTQEESELTKL